MLKFFAVFALLSPLAAQAQSGVAADVAVRESPSRWQLGIGASISDSPYAGEGTRVTPVPWVTYEGDRWFWRGLSGGIHVLKSDGFALDAIVSGRLDGFDIDDLGRRELARNGLDAALLEDRDNSLDAGVAVSWRGAAGEIKLQALADVTDASGGYELSLDYGYQWRWGRTILVPSVGARWLSKDMTRYYYGTLDEEVARGVPAYRPGAALLPQVKLSVLRPLGEKWRLFGAISYRFLPNEVSDSPFLEPDRSGSGNVQVGVSRSF